MHSNGPSLIVVETADKMGRIERAVKLDWAITENHISRAQNVSLKEKLVGHKNCELPELFCLNLTSQYYHEEKKQLVGGKISAKAYL